MRELSYDNALKALPPKISPILPGSSYRHEVPMVRVEALRRQLYAITFPKRVSQDEQG